MIALTPRVVALIGHEEGLVREAYLDSAAPPVWTWALGVAATSGIDVLQYKDRPQPINMCLKASIDMMRRRYLPDVLDAFGGFPLSEAQLAAALSFHWNTGAIARTAWVSEVVQGEMDSARAFLEAHYTNDRTDDGINNGTLTARRAREAALFFDSVWPADLRVPIVPVSKPSYRPAFSRAVPTDLMPMLQQIMGGH